MPKPDRRSEADKRERKAAAGRLAIEMMVDTWNQFAVGDDKKKWAGGLSVLEDIEDMLRLHDLIDEHGQVTDKAKRGEHLVLDRPEPDRRFVVGRRTQRGLVMMTLPETLPKAKELLPIKQRMCGECDLQIYELTEFVPVEDKP